MTASGGAARGTACVSISRLSDPLCHHHPPPPPPEARLAQPAWCLLDKGLCWHLSVSGQPSVAPSISLADRRGPRGITQSRSPHRLYATLPAARMRARTAAAQPFTFAGKLRGLELRPGQGITLTTRTDSDICSLPVTVSSSLTFCPFLSSSPSHFFPPALHAFPACALRPMDNSCSAGLWEF